uniref:Uncharacterized protein n=1 Tax=Timema douglasi TaxID=61478 RepID=A0A7R8VM06_TIMDO|nr:unnamed protein product [Timema douglasi]
MTQIPISPPRINEQVPCPPCVSHSLSVTRQGASQETLHSRLNGATLVQQIGMAATGGSVGVSGSSWPKWSVAVVVGVPVAVGVGYWYWKHRSPLPGQGDKAEILAEKPKLSSLASANQEISLDTAGVDSNSAMKEEVVQVTYFIPINKSCF